jgi:outer membrane receptor protein involved in Fe transport
MRYLGRQIISAGALGEYEDFFSFEGRPPENADFADVTWYDPRFYHDIRFSVDVTPRYNMYLGVDNLTNIMPQYAATGLGQGTAIYDVRGRFLYAGFSAKF